MMASRAAASRPPPSPSAVSARPSSWNAPVSAMPAPTASSAGSSGVSKSDAAARSTVAARPPTNCPTSGNQRALAPIHSG